MKVLVTGGAGFIGSHIADACIEAGMETAVLDNLSSGRRGNVPARAVFYQVDIRDASELKKAVADFGPDLVSHQAAQVSVSYSVREPSEDAEVNVVGTVNLMEACCELGVKHVIFASTGGAIYGEVPAGECAAVDWTPRPLSPYACSKLAAETYLQAYADTKALDSTILRYANVYGPRQDPHGEAGVVAIFSRRLAQGRPLRIFARRSAGDSGCVRDYTYVADVVEANLACAQGRLDGLRVVNVGTGRGTTTLELAKAMSRFSGRNSEVVFDGPRPGDLEISVLDSRPLREKLKCDPTPLEEGLKKTLEWFGKHSGGRRVEESKSWKSRG